MVIKFTDKFYNANMVGKSKDLPDHIAKSLIKSGDGVAIEADVEPKKRTKKVE